MSEAEELTGADAAAFHISGAERRPSTELTPDEPKTYEGTQDGLREAANDLSRARSAATEQPETKVYYKEKTGTGDRPLFTDAKQAAKDLSQFHREQDAERLIPELQNLQQEVDLARQMHGVNPPYPPVQTNVPPVQQPYEAQQQPGELPTAQPEDDVPPPVDGIDPEVTRAFSNPKVMAVVEPVLQEAQRAQKEAIDGLRNNALYALSLVTSRYPEIANYTAEQLPVALHAIAQQNPQRAQEIQRDLTSANQIYQQALAANQQTAKIQQQQFQQQFQNWTKAEDDKFLQGAPELKDDETMSRASKAALKTLEGVGFSKDELAKGYYGESAISLRDHRAQLIIWKAAQYDALKGNPPQAAAKPLPPVQRPGVSASQAEYAMSNVPSAREALKGLSGIEAAKAGARLLAARRAAGR